MRTLPLAVAVALALVLAGCAPTVSLTPAVQATSPACAAVVVGLPATIGAAEKRTTDAQGTAAWGEDPAITLRCGVTRTPADRCYSIGGVEWTHENTTVGRTSAVVLTTYGRDPVVQVVQPEVTGPAATSTSDVLLAVSEPVRRSTRATGQRCGAETAAPAPTPSASR